MPDYNEAIANRVDSAKWTGRLPSGEKIMASTMIYNYPGGKYGGAVRLMVSLDAIDTQLVRILLVVIFACIGFFSLLIISGVMFISSIVNPVKSIGETAKCIAGGDLEAVTWLPSKYPELADDLPVIRQSVKDAMKEPFVITQQAK
jgi:hypothetical protein